MGVTGLGDDGRLRILCGFLQFTNGRQDMAKRVAEIKSLEHKIKTLADASLKRYYHSAEPAQDVGRLAKRALFKLVLNCSCTAPVTQSVAYVPCQRSGRTFLDCTVGTRPEQCGFQVQYESCTLCNFVVNLSNVLYLLLYA